MPPHRQPPFTCYEATNESNFPRLLSIDHAINGTNNRPWRCWVFDQIFKMWDVKWMNRCDNFWTHGTRGKFLSLNLRCSRPAEFCRFADARNFQIWLVDHYDGPWSTRVNRMIRFPRFGLTADSSQDLRIWLERWMICPVFVDKAILQVALVLIFELRIAIEVLSEMHVQSFVLFSSPHLHDLKHEQGSTKLSVCMQLSGICVYG